jgi:hypothetical protein
MVTHQPGWGGRGSAGIGDGSRLWVAPTAAGTNAWSATARGCWTNLPQSLAALGDSCDLDEEGLFGPKGKDANKTKSCDCNGVACSRHEETFTGYLSASSCMELQSDDPPDSVEKIQAEALRAWWGDFSSPNFATALVIGSNVEGIAFFDNKLDESHVALARCKPQQWTANCWLEFHWFDPWASGTLNPQP